jgi:hypothetical protein
MNTELTKYYMGLQKTQQLHSLPTTPEVTSENIIFVLDEYFGGQWTWELADEKIFPNDGLLTTVTVYTPGHIYTGRNFTNVAKCYEQNHLSAILNACQSLMSVKAEQPKIIEPRPQPTQPVQTQPNPAPQQMTAEQIMSAINQEMVLPKPQEQIRNLEELNNLKDANGKPIEEVPFDSISNLCMNESQQAMGMLPDYDAPQEKYKGF